MNQEVELFWKRFLKAQGLDENTKCLDVFYFDLTEEWANKLAEMVLSGQKCATSSSLKSWELENKMPKVGDYSIVTNWAGTPQCVIKTIGVQTLPFKEITYDICKREGEDDSLESWQRSHTSFFTEEGKELGYEFTEDLLVVFEDFEVVYKEYTELV